MSEGVLLPVALVDRLASVLERIEPLLATRESGNPPAGGDGLLTKQEVAGLLGGKCSVRKVERLVKKGKLRQVPNLGCRMARFRRADVERLLAEPESRPGRLRL